MSATEHGAGAANVGPDLSPEEAMEPNPGKWCLASEEPEGFFCTRTVDHPGDHVAFVSDTDPPLARWPQEAAHVR